MVAVDFFSFRVDAHSMDQNSMAFVSPVASRFEKALSALLPISVSPSRGWDHVGKDIERLRKQAEAVSGEEFTQNEYLRRVMELRGEVVDYLKPGIDQVFVAWMANGALFADPRAVSDGAMARIALDNAALLMDVLPTNPMWHQMTCETEFGAHAGAGAHIASLRAVSVEEENRALAANAGWAQQISWLNEGAMAHRARVHAIGQKTRDACRLIELSDASGRLQTLKDTGRESAWLLHCLTHGNQSYARRALDAGLRLDQASARAVQAFMGEQANMSPQSMFKAEAFLNEQRKKGLTEGKLKPSAKKTLDALRQEDWAARWGIWETAVKAGLPKIESVGMPVTVDGKPAFLMDYAWAQKINPIDPDFFAPLIQEIQRRDQKMDSALRGLWTRVCLGSPWPELLAQKAGGKPGESAMAWALRRGAVEPADWRVGEFMECIYGAQNGGANAGEVIQSFAAMGVGPDMSPSPQRVLTIRNTTGVSHIAVLLHAASDAAGLARGLLALGVDLAQTGADGRTFIPALLDTGSKRAAEACVAALDALESAAAGSGPALANTVDKDGATALHWAARALELPMMQKLVELGADVNARDKKGQTILHWAARKYGAKAEKRFVPIIEFLHDQGFDWAAVDQKGDTGVAALAKKGPVAALVKAIEAAPQSVGVKNKIGKTALDHLSGREGAGKAVAQAEGAVMREELRAATTAASQDEANVDGASSEAPKKRAGRRI